MISLPSLDIRVCSHKKKFNFCSLGRFTSTRCGLPFSKSWSLRTIRAVYQPAADLTYDSVRAILHMSFYSCVVKKWKVSHIMKIRKSSANHYPFHTPGSSAAALDSFKSFYQSRKRSANVVVHRAKAMSRRHRSLFHCSPVLHTTYSNSISSNSDMCASTESLNQPTPNPQLHLSTLSLRHF